MYVRINYINHEHLLRFITAAVAGFSCPEEKTLGPNGQPLAHPSFPHPLSCQKFITCYF